MSGEPLPETSTAADLRAPAASSPWRFTTVHFTTVHFTTVHFTHRRQQDGGGTASGEPVEAWLDRLVGRGGRAVLRRRRGGRGRALRRVCRPGGLRRRRRGCCPLLDSPAGRIHEYGPDAPALTSDGLATVYCVHLDVRTGIAVDITPLDGTTGSGLAPELHAVDELLDPPL